MLEIGDTLVSLDVIEKEFICNLEACLGACCIEGDAGAPLEEEERQKLYHAVPYPDADEKPVFSQSHHPAHH